MREGRNPGRDILGRSRARIVRANFWRRPATGARDRIKLKVAPCELTDKEITSGTCHVHHEAPTFAELVGAFLSERGVAPEDVQFVRADGIEGATLAPAWTWLATEFAAHHRLHAQLLVVHAHEHLSLPRNAPGARSQ